MHDRKDASVSKAGAKRPRVLFVYYTYARQSLRVVESMAAVGRAEAQGGNGWLTPARSK
jgi:hypothetical protein